jgi:hypothetical protein
LRDDLAHHRLALRQCRRRRRHGLDYLFARWKPRLQPGDIVYLPLEEAQYLRSRAASDLGPDAAIMLRHDRATLQTMPLHRRIAALFVGDLRAVIMSLIETGLADEDR